MALKWKAPAANADGSPLVPLAGYRLLYGRTPEELDQSVHIGDDDILDCALEALEPGLWYFAVVTQSTSGLEGPLSNVVWKIVT